MTTFLEYISPDWRRGVTVTHEFRTGIFSSRRGLEQRMAHRSTPRTTLRFSVLLDRPRLDDFRLHMQRKRSDLFLLPDFSGEGATVLRSTETSVTLESVPFWLEPGADVAVTHDRRSEIRTVASVAGHVVRFVTPPSQPWGPGTVLRPTTVGRLDPAVRVNYLTDSVATVDLNFSVDPGTSPLTLGMLWGAFDDREVFEHRPNWRNPIGTTHEAFVETIDHGYGVVRTFQPVPFNWQVEQSLHTFRSAAEIARFQSFLGRLKGRRGEFFLPSWRPDLVPVAPIAVGDTALRVQGAAVANLYDDGVHRSLAIVGRDRGLTPAKIVSMRAEGDTTVLALEQPFFDGFALDEIEMVCWMPLCRLATDSVQVNLLTDSVAEVVFHSQSLPYGPPERPLLDSATTYMIDTFGVNFSLNGFIDPIQVAVNVTYPEIVLQGPPSYIPREGGGINYMEIGSTFEVF